MGNSASVARLALCFVMLPACSNEPPDRNMPEPECGECRIQVTLGPTLGDAEGAGALPGVPLAVRVDELQRIWVLPSPGFLPMVFTPDGQFYASVGNLGNGPGEFRHVTDVAFAPGDTAIVFDVSGRVTVLDSDLSVLRSTRLAGAQVWNSIVFGGTNDVLLSGLVRTEEAAGWTMHRSDLSHSDAVIMRSFGGDGSLSPSGESAAMLRTHLANSDSGRFWAARMLEYGPLLYDTTGSQLLGTAEDPAWFPRGTNPSLGSSSRPPTPLVVGMYEDKADLLWVFTHVPRSNWKQAFNESEMSGSEARGIDFEKLFQTRIEVLEPEHDVLVAAGILDRFTISVMNDGVLATYDASDGGIPRVQMLRSSLVRPHQ